MSKRAEKAANKYIGHPFEPDEDSAITLARSGYFQGYEQAEKDTITRIREQVKQWMPKKDGEEHTNGEMVAFNSILQLLKTMEENNG